MQKFIKTAIIMTCLVLFAAGAAHSRPFVRGIGCTVSEHETVADLLDCFGEPMYTETVEEYEIVRGKRVVEKTITIFYYRIDEAGTNQPELFGFHIYRGEIIEIKRIGR